MGRFDEGHNDDGSGRCSQCFEDWPCEIRAAGRTWGESALERWERQERDRRREIEWAAREALEEKINSLLAEMGTDVRWGHGNSTITVRLEDFIQIIRYLTNTPNFAASEFEEMHSAVQRRVY